MKQLEEYNKPSLSFQQQAKLLMERGLIADENELASFLKRTNYYRFSTYLYPFRQLNSDNFKPDTEFAKVYMLYEFDHALRVLLFDALTVLEVAILRTRFVEFFTLKYGPFGYTDVRNFNIEIDKHKRLLTELEQIERRSRKNQEPFVAHFRNKYSNEYLPLWVVVEIISIGNIITMFHSMHHKDKKNFAQDYNISYKVLVSWLYTLKYVRNCCAHHARLWNRALSTKPLPKSLPEFNTIRFDNTRIFSVMTIIQYLLRVVDPSNIWGENVIALLDRYPAVPIDQMGFPEKWQELPMWENLRIVPDWPQRP